MARNDNYPDDIRQYDNDPRSPFYDSREDDEVRDKADAVGDLWLAELNEFNEISELGLDRADLLVLVEESNHVSIEGLIYECAFQEVSSNREKYLSSYLNWS